MNTTLTDRLRTNQAGHESIVEVSPEQYDRAVADLTEAEWAFDPTNIYATLAAHDRLLDFRRPYKRHNGCLITADYKTPASDQRYGYLLEPRA